MSRRTREPRLRSRREVLQTLALTGALVACGEAGPSSGDSGATDASGDGTSTDTTGCAPVLQGAQITHGPLTGGVTGTSVRVALRLDKAAKVEVELQGPAGAKIRTACTIASEAADFAVVLTASGLTPLTTYQIVPIVDDVAVPAAAIQTRTFATAGTEAAFTFAFGSCQRHGQPGNEGPSKGKTYDVVVAWQERPAFFAQIGDWTYPDYAFTKSGLDPSGNNYTAYPEELRKSWHRRLDPAYPMRKVLAQVPVAHVWDDHDFAQNNSHKDVTGLQADRVAAFERYLPCYPVPASKSGVWQQFSFGHADFWLVDMRSQRTDVTKAVIEKKDTKGNVTYELVEPAGHSVLGPEQLAWLIDSLKTSKAMWKFVFLPVEVNPAYDLMMAKAMEMGLKIVVEAVGDTWSGYPTERKKLLDLHTSGAVKNIVFLTGDAHQAAMRQRDDQCPPIFMSANLDIQQAPVIDVIELADVGIQRQDIWPHWTQDGSGDNTVGRLRIETSPKHRVICQSYDTTGKVLQEMVIEAQA